MSKALHNELKSAQENLKNSYTLLRHLTYEDSPLGKEGELYEQEDERTQNRMHHFQVLIGEITLLLEKAEAYRKSFEIETKPKRTRKRTFN